jgi:RNA ligase (TIGR02306 family)
MSSRKLATIRKIDAIHAIPQADAIEVAVVGGWQVVVKRGEFKPGDLAVYLEIDSWVPNHLAPFLSKGREPREFNLVKGERLRTVKLRGQVSQGLLLAIETAFPGKDQNFFWSQVDQDVTELLGIQKWEAPIPAQLSGVMRGNFPSFIPKTDQERIQNLAAQLEVWKTKYMRWEITEKLDGSSMTVYVMGDHMGVCSRNIELELCDTNTYCTVAKQLDIFNKICNSGLDNIAIQGELVGPNIQGNKYSLTEHKFFVFDIYCIETQQYYTPQERWALVEQLGLDHAPLLASHIELASEATMQSLLEFSDGPSIIATNYNTLREGVVFKCHDFDVSFKCISNKWLLKHE